MELARSEKGARKLIRNGYMYLYQKDLAGEVTSWEGELRRRGHCKPRVKLDWNNAILHEVNDHTHPPTMTKSEVAKVKANIKRRARTSSDSLQ